MAQDKMLKFLVEGLTRAFDKQEDCDVMFSVDGQTIGAHRLILNIHSQVLYEMAAGWTPDKDPIAIDDMSFDSFKALLRYMYSSEIPLSNDTVFVYLAASTHLKMNFLEELCVGCIAKSIRITNVCMYMNEAVNFQSTCLKEKCLDLFAEDTSEISYQESFLKLSQPALSAFLDAEQTNILEVMLFHTVKRWMQGQCRDQGLPVNGTNMRQAIGDALYKLRFPTMTAQDFANSVTTVKGFLTESEENQVFRKITVFDNEEIECPFPDKFRCQMSVYQEPFDKMEELYLQKVLCDSQQCDLRSLLTSLKDPNRRSMGNLLASLRIVLQCYADLANSCDRTTFEKGEHIDIRKDLCDDILAWPEIADQYNLCDTMTKYMDIRRKLNRICKWSLT